MKFKEHCEESLKLFGDKFEHVHHWLDAYFYLVDETGKGKCDVYHRCKRHHIAGAEEVRRIWGDIAYEAAIRHIISDLTMGGGFKEGRDELPKDQQDFLKKGFV